MSTRPGDSGTAQESDDRGTGTPPPPRSGDRTETAPRRSSRRAGFGAVLGALALLLGAALIWGGIAPLTESRDTDGYYMSDLFTVDRPSRAIVTRDVDLLRGRWETLAEESFVDLFVAEPDDIRMQGVASGSNGIFLGIGATTAIDEYLDGVAYDEITDWDADLASILDVEYTPQEGTASPDAPGDETFWVASASGTGTQTLDWTIETGDWTAVIMNADASSGVTAELAFGTSPPSAWDTLHWTSFAVGLVLVVGGGLLLYWALRRPGGDTSSLDIE